jgi:hypothetical protein
VHRVAAAAKNFIMEMYLLDFGQSLKSAVGWDTQDRCHLAFISWYEGFRPGLSASFFPIHTYSASLHTVQFLRI